MGLRQRLTSTAAWTDVANNFRHDWKMLYKEIAVGFLLAGFIGLLGNGFFNSLFISGAPGWLNALENVIVGPLIAVLSFVCSVGNIPLAAVLWSGGISFAGVMAFIFADLIVLPIIAIYRKYYGWPFTLRISRPDAGDDDRRGAGRRRPLRRPAPDPDHPAQPRRHLRLGPARLQAGAELDRAGRLRCPLQPRETDARRPRRREAGDGGEQQRHARVVGL